MCAVALFTSATGGLLLLFCWLQDRSTPSLALWGAGYLVGALGAALMALRGYIPDIWSVFGALTLVCVAYGLMWGGARSFEGRPIRISAMLAGAGIWIVACQIDAFYAYGPARVVLASSILATYALLIAREVWYARDKELISRWPTLVLVVLHAAFLLARIALARAMPFPVAATQPQSAIVIMAFEALFVNYCLAFLRVNMAKERAELYQRRAALVDPLTGIANRRAFFDVGGPLLERSLAERRPAALLLFDLDRFKQVNDTAGHQAGDRLLKAFADIAAAQMRPGDVFGRLGGEEFACLSVNTSMAQALQAAERVRREFEATAFPGPPTSATVSIGVAMAADAGSNLHMLLAAADAALYRAKAKGRNRVEPARAPLTLVETAGAAAG